MPEATEIASMGMLEYRTPAGLVYATPATAQYFSAQMQIERTGKTIETAANIVETVFNGFAIMRINRDLDSLEDARYDRRDAAKAFYDALANPSTATDAQRAEKFKKYVVAQDDVDFYQTRTIETHLQTLYVATGASAVKVLGSLQGVSAGAYLEDSSGANSLLTAAGLGAVAGAFISWSMSDRRNGRRGGGRRGRRDDDDCADSWDDCRR